MKKITNMEQIRAARAIKVAEKILKNRGGEGDQLSGYHALIITNGLMATLAYSLDKGKECKLIAESLIGHIAALQKEKRFPGQPVPENDLMGAIDTIARDATPAMLAMLTDECMAFLNYLKRFVRALNIQNKSQQ